MTQTMVAENLPEVALADLGVEPELLSEDERRSLDVDGFVVLEDVIAEDRRRNIRERIDERLKEAQQPDNRSDTDVRRWAARSLEQNDRSLEALELRGDAIRRDLGDAWFRQRLEQLGRREEALRGALAADDVASMRKLFQSEGGCVDELFESDPVFHLTIQSARVLTAVAHILGPMFHLLNLVVSNPRPGHGQQILHRTDSGARRISTTLWLIDDMTLENGATRIVRGSHLRSQGLPAEMEGDPTRTHPDEIRVVGRAGSVVVFDDRCWHSAGVNKSGEPRLVLISSFTQRCLYPSISLTHPEETLARLSPGQRWLLHQPGP